MQKILTYTLLIFMITSCDKGEIPIPPHQTGDLITTTIEMQQDYRYQIFYKLKDNTVVSQNLKTSWDIGFESNIDGWRIFLNSSLGGAAWKITDSSFESVFSINNPQWNWDNPSGNIDSTAIGDYQNQNIFFIIDRGYNISGNPIGYIKFRIDSINEIGYMVRYASLDNSLDTNVWIDKQVNKQKTCFSFSENKVINIEPNISDWDLLFSQYLHIFPNPPTPYLVNGILINNSTLSVALDTINSFENINYTEVSQYDFNQKRDFIGYNWKIFDFESSSYSIVENMNYILQDGEGHYYKLRFIDFYNDLGEKGYPTFEIQQL